MVTSSPSAVGVNLVAFDCVGANRKSLHLPEFQEHKEDAAVELRNIPITRRLLLFRPHFRNTRRRTRDPRPNLPVRRYRSMRRRSLYAFFPISSSDYYRFSFAALQ